MPNTVLEQEVILKKKVFRWVQGVYFTEHNKVTIVYQSVKLFLKMPFNVRTLLCCFRLGQWQCTIESFMLCYTLVTCVTCNVGAFQTSPYLEQTVPLRTFWVWCMEQGWFSLSWNIELMHFMENYWLFDGICKMEYTPHRWVAPHQDQQHHNQTKLPPAITMF